MEVYIKVSNLKVQIHNGIFTIIIFLQILGPTCHLNQRCNKNFTTGNNVWVISLWSKPKHSNVEKWDIISKFFFFFNSTIKLTIFHYNNEMASFMLLRGKKSSWTTNLHIKLKPWFWLNIWIWLSFVLFKNNSKVWLKKKSPKKSVLNKLV